MTGMNIQITRCGGLWDRLVDTGAEATADGDVTGGVAGLSPLVPQFFFPSPFGPPIRKPYLEIRRNRSGLCLPQPILPPLASTAPQTHTPSPRGSKSFSRL